MFKAAAAFGVARSFTGRRWLLKPVNAALESALLRELPPVVARLLAVRGIGPPQAAEYLAPRLKNLLPDPFVLKDMEAAVGRVAAALEAGERIAVFGDYDVDGSTSAALLSDFLSALGTPPRIYIPDRMKEGYGPSAAAMRVLSAEGAQLVITVDCGAAATAALDEGRALGMDVVVLDHHRVETAPRAVAHVNPNQPGDTSGLGYLCAAGVTFLFLVALNRHLRQTNFYRERGLAEPDLRLFMDLVGLATICDVVPLKDLNRAFVRCWDVTDRPAFTPRSFGLGRGRRRQGAVHALSLGICLRSAHQCRRPGGPFVTGRGFVDHARGRQG